MARIGTFDPTRLTYHVFTHWNYEAVRHVANQNGGKQNHGRHIHIWRWEYYMYKYINPTWFSLAQDREVWRAHTFSAKAKITDNYSEVGFDMNTFRALHVEFEFKLLPLVMMIPTHITALFLHAYREAMMVGDITSFS